MTTATVWNPTALRSKPQSIPYFTLKCTILQLFPSVPWFSFIYYYVQNIFLEEERYQDE